MDLLDCIFVGSFIFYLVIVPPTENSEVIDSFPELVFHLTFHVSCRALEIVVKQHNFSAPTAGQGPAASVSVGNSNQAGGTSDENKEAPSTSAAQVIQGNPSSAASEEKKEAVQSVLGNQALDNTSTTTVSQDTASRIPAPAAGSIVTQASISTVGPAAPTLVPSLHPVIVNQENYRVPDSISQTEQASGVSERTSQHILPITPLNLPSGGSEAAASLTYAAPPISVAPLTSAAPPTTVVPATSAVPPKSAALPTSAAPQRSAPPPTSASPPISAANAVTSATSTAPIVDISVGRGKKRKQPTTKPEVEVTPRQTRRKTNSTESVGPKSIDPPKTRGQAKAAQLGLGESTPKTSSPVVVTRTRARLLEKAVSTAATRKGEKTDHVDDPSSTTASQSAGTSSTGAQVSDVGHSSERFESTAATTTDVGGVNHDGTASGGSAGAPGTTSAVHPQGNLEADSAKDGLKAPEVEAHAVKQVGDGLPEGLGVSSSSFTEGLLATVAPDMHGTSLKSMGGIQGSTISASPAGTGRNNFIGGHPEYTQPALVACTNALVHENHPGSGENDENVTTNQGKPLGQSTVLSSALPTVVNAVAVVDKSSTGGKGGAQTPQQVMI